MPDTATLVPQALAPRTCAGWNVEGLDEAAGCRDWLTARKESGVVKGTRRGHEGMW